MINIPFISIVIPVLNEESFILKCIESLMTQDIGPDSFELIIVDGGSTDKTIEIVKQYKAANKNIKLIHNSKKYTPFAFNLGIKHSSESAKYIAFLNSHAEYSKDRLSKSIHFLKSYNVDAVGGRSIAKSRNNSTLGKAMSLVLRSIFSTGSTFRSESTEIKLADTASGTLYTKEIINKIGLFNERLICSQDIEYNKRLKKIGGKLLYVPELVTYYKSRADLKSFITHTIRNGQWAILPFKYSSIIPVSIRHVSPLIITLLFLFLILLSLLQYISIYIPLTMFLLYAIANLLVSTTIAVKKKRLVLIPFLFFSFFSFHAAYALGSLMALYKIIFNR